MVKIKPLKAILLASVAAIFIVALYQTNNIKLRIAGSYAADEAIAHRIRDVVETVIPSKRDNFVNSHMIYEDPDENRQWTVLSRMPVPECWTVSDRYRPYVHMDSDILTHINQFTPKTKTCFVLRLSARDFEDGSLSTPESILFLRSLIIEVAWIKGYDFKILIHLTNDTPLNWLKTLDFPKEYKKLVVLFHTSDVQKNYNMTNLLFKPTSSDDGSFIGYYNHIATEWFAKKYTQYDFFWVAEFDLRLIGRWDQFFDLVENEYKSLRNPHLNPEYPDLALFQAPYQPNENDPFSLNCFFPKDEQRKGIGILYGWSRRLVDAMKPYIDKSENCYFELFMQSLAYRENLTTFYHDHSVFYTQYIHDFLGNPIEPAPMMARQYKKNEYDVGYNDFGYETGTYVYFAAMSPDYGHARRWYEYWLQNHDKCRPSSLVHPIKKFYDGVDLQL